MKILIIGFIVGVVVVLGFKYSQNDTLILAHGNIGDGHISEFTDKRRKGFPDDDVLIETCSD